MIRREQGTFRVNGGRLNVQDNAYANTPAAGASQYTAGATILEPIALFPAGAPGGSNDWSVIGFSIGARLAIAVSADVTKNTVFGKFGNIVAGVTTIGDKTQGAGLTPWLTPALPLPNDLSLVGDLWTPEGNPLPPSFSRAAASGPLNGGPPVGLQVKLTQTLPQPVAIPRGNNLLIGIWELPSLIAASTPNANLTATLCVLDAVWSLVYDDGAV